MRHSRKTKLITYFFVMFIAVVLLLLLSYCMELGSTTLDHPAAAAAATYEEAEGNDHA